MAVKLYEHQLSALAQMKNGCILNGGTGSGKSLTSLAYYYLRNGGKQSTLEGKGYIKMPNTPKDLYIITTALKRDTLEWEDELCCFLLSVHTEANLYSNKIVVDSWNNIKKYSDVKNAFFIFDEQRLVGNGAWVKSFLKISKTNEWILLSATPGDKWEDYIPVFIANGFYKNRSEFTREHLVFSRFSKFPKVERYLNIRRLSRLRDRILIEMDFERKTVAHHEDIYVDYDMLKYKSVMKNRWDVYKNEPIQNAAGLCYILRKVVNSDDSRQVALLGIVERHPRVIIFYNFDYELDILKNLYYGDDFKIAEWNGHKHQPLPTDKKWIYLVQYTAGNEGWNCISTNAVVFYSQNYSYKVLKQACGRIDRLNTPYLDLYYYHLKSRSGIDLAISKALKQKKKFNEGQYTNRMKW